MSKYKVGDKIRYISSTLPGEATNGKIYIVVRLDCDGDPVIINDAGLEDPWHAFHFEPYEDTELEVGQTVRVCSPEEGRDEPELNNSILKLTEFDGEHWHAEKLDGSDYWYFSPKELEPFDTHGLDITHADDKTVTVRHTHEELANLACVDLRNKQAVGWLDTAHELNLNKLDRADTYNLHDFVKNSPLLDHLRPEPEKFEPGWYVQVEDKTHYNVMYIKSPHNIYKTRIESELPPFIGSFGVKYCESDGIFIKGTAFTEDELRQHALDIARDGQKTIGCQTITRDKLPELIKFFEEFIPMARQAVEDEKKRLGKDTP